MGTDPEESTSISVCRNGPLLVRGDFHLLSDEGSPLGEQRKTIALCRCGHSERKPFCDGSHRRAWAAGGPDDQRSSRRGAVLPLTSAQQSLWLAQQLIGDVPLTVAQAVDLRGEVDVERLLAASYQAGDEYGTTRARLVVGDEGPVMSLSRTDFTIAEVDLRAESDSVLAARAWTDRAVRRPLRIADDPLAQTALLRVGDRHVILFSRVHHILLDGYGALNLLRRTAELYLGTPTDQAIGGPEILLDADDRYRFSARRERDRAYWAEVLAELPDPAVVGLVRAAPTIAVERHGSTLRRGTAGAIADCATRYHVLPSAVVIAGIAAYLARIVDAERIVLSLPVSARNTAAVRTAAGTTSNIVPLVVDARSDLRVGEYLGSVSRRLTGLLRHQQYRHEDMLRDAGIAAAGLHQFGPVINVFPFAPRIPLGGVDADYTVVSTGPVADLNINLYPTADGRNHRIEVEANPAGYASGTLSRHREQLELFLEDFARLPDNGVLGDLDFVVDVHSLTASARQLTLADVFALGPSDEHIAVASTSGVLTFAELRCRAGAFAAELRAAGVGPDTAVAVQLGRSIESVIAFWAVALAGGIYVPIDPRYPQARVDQILLASAPRVVVGVGLSVVESTISGSLIDAGPTAGSARRDNIAYQIFTSGSTGAPKGVAVTGTGIGPLVAEIEGSYRLGRDCVVAHFASPSFDTAIVEMVAAHCCGARLHIIASTVTGGAELGAELSRGGVTHLLITPAALATLDPATVPTVREVIAGGDVCPPSLARRWIAAGVRLRCAYGPTETTCSVTISAALDPASISPLVPIGQPMPAVSAWVLDTRLRPQPVGAVGELYIGGPSLARGYLSAPATASRFVANPFGEEGSRLYRTGDRVCRRVDGSFDFVGRTDNQLKIRGFRVETGEIDAVLLGLDGVAESLTIGIRRGSGSALASFVTGTDLTAEGLRGSLRKVLPEFLVPASITVLPRFPLTPSGKVDRAALPTPARSLVVFRAPSNEVESACVAAFSTVLGDSGVGADHDFFASGGDSLSATRLVDAINAEIGSALTAREVFEGRTPAGIAALISPPDPALRHLFSTEPIALAPAQRNVDIVDRSAANLIPFAVRVPEVDVERLAAALTEVVAAHPILTASFADGVMRPNAVAAPTVREVPGDVSEFVHAGFDLRVESAFRIGLCESMIAISAHHVAIDGASLRTLLTDLLTAYAGGAVDRAEFDYFDYARWMAGVMGDVGDPASRYAEQLSFWRSTLAGVGPLGPLDGHARPAIWDPRGARLRVPLTPDVWEGLTESAATAGATPFAVFRAAVARVVTARSGSSEVVIGTPIDGRRDSRLAGVVGMFVNTLPLRYLVDVGASVRDIAAAHVDVERDALRHSDIGYVDVAAALGDPTGPHHPLFQVVVSSESPDVDLPGIESLPAPIAKCDLHFALTPPSADRGGAVDVLYPVAMYDEAWVRGLVAEVLGSVSENNPTRL